MRMGEKNWPGRKPREAQRGDIRDRMEGPPPARRVVRWVAGFAEMREKIPTQTNIWQDSLDNGGGRVGFHLRAIKTCRLLETEKEGPEGLRGGAWGEVRTI